MKQTEIGLIPDDWEVNLIGNVSEIFGRIGFRGYTVEDLVDEGFGAITLSPSNIQNGKMDFSNCSYISWKKYDESPEIKIANGDILLVKTGSTYGKSAIVKNLAKKATINPQFVVIKKTKCNNELLGYLIQTPIVQEQIEASIVGGAIPTLSQKQIASFKIPLSKSIKEQQRIAKALSDVDALISTTEKLLQKKRNIKQGTMQELLTGKKRLPGFAKSNNTKMTELGEIPEDWEVKRFYELINDISDGPFGSNLKTEHYTTEREVRIIQLSNVGEDGWDNENVKYTTFTHAKEIQRCIVPYGSIVIAKMMPAGRAILCPNKEKMYILGSDCVRITPNSLLDSLFFIYFTKSSFYLNQIKENTQGSTRARTSVSKLKRIEIVLPPKKEQISIAKILSDMDNEIDLLNKKLEKYRNLKTAMMQQLLTGKIRLV